MQLGLAAPGDRERDADAEDDHVAEGDAEKRWIGQMQHNCVEAIHDDGNDEAKRDHDGCERDSEPAESAMDFYVVSSNQR